VLAWWQFLLCGGHQIDFDICTMLNLMSSSLSLGKLMKLREILVEIHPIWWPVDGFCPWTYWVWCQIKVLLKIYAMTWKYGWNSSYLVAMRWVLFHSLLSLVSNLAFCWKFMQITWKDDWNMSYLVATKGVLASPCVLN
jgi:hypothetical protein